jgi:hypothetical protein
MPPDALVPTRLIAPVRRGEKPAANTLDKEIRWFKAKKPVTGQRYTSEYGDS